MQVLQIHITPAKYELEIENAKLQYQQNFVPTASVSTEPAKAEIKTTPTKARMDSYEARKSLGFAKVDDIIAHGTEKAQKNLSQYIQKTVQMGKDMARIEDGVTIRDLMRQKVLESPSTYTAFLPSTGVSISWQPNEFSYQFEPAKTNYDWNIKDNQYEYIPGSVRMRIVEKGDVSIEYIGDPNYVPPSANPNYESTEEC